MWWMAECHADFPLLTETAWGRRRVDDEVGENYRKHGLTASDDMTALERNRCVINQDIGVTLPRLGEGITWVQERLGVHPIWNCGVRLPNPDAVARETQYLVDIGIYGEPKVSGYRHIRDLRALQRMADAPSLWGASYLTWDELCAVNPHRYELYERARIEAGSAGAFLHLRDKVVWVDGSQLDEGRIPMWRLRRSFGKRWYLNPFVYPLLAAVLASKAIWCAPRVR